MPLTVNDDLLTPEEREIFKAFLNVPEVQQHYTGQTNGALTFEMIGLEMGLSRQRVHDLHKSALRKIRLALIEQNPELMKQFKIKL